MATIKDIANKIGVSVSTVSKGLNGASDVSEETRQLILNTALEVGYVSKRAHSTNAKKKICIFIENMGYENIEQFGYEIIVSFKLAAVAKQWDVDIIPISMNEKFDYNYEDYMIEHHYSGGFMLGFTLHNDFIKQLSLTKIPTVLLDNTVLNKHVACVGVDNELGISCAVEHLCSLGHTKIAMLNGEAHSRVSQERLSGFLLGMDKCGLKADKSLIVHDDFNKFNSENNISDFVSKGVTAILCASDVIAHGVISQLYNMGVRVPTEISVIGFDDLPLARYTTPPLTTIKQNRLALGSSACMVMEQIMSGNYINRLMLMPELVVRSSTTGVNK